MKPILFNTAMVQAILEGRKTCTRRVVKGNVKDLNVIGSSSNDGVNFNCVSFGYGNINDINSVDIKERVKAPYLPGDILYVRETWLAHSRGFNTLAFKYKADGAVADCVSFKKERFNKFYKFADQERWQPSLFMPVEAARIFLKVTDVRVERLDQMIIADCLSEGIRAYTKDDKLYKYAVNDEQYTWRNMPHNPHKAFKDLWDSTLKKDQLEQYGFNANPYVWVIEFERCEKTNE